MIFCTLFNSGYLDKGLVMFDSLKNVNPSFKLYIVAFDDKCYEILSEIEDERLIPISLAEFEDERLLKAKANRTEQEYCWTCSCHVIKHVIEKYHEPMCTYIDVDMFFYSDPQILFDEIETAHCDVGIIEHRLIDNEENRRIIRLAGRFCVEFNTFYANENGMKILNWWCDRCIELCTATQDGIHFGDQKYLDDWETRFERVHVLKHLGAGVAPWNVAQYRLISRNKNQIIMRHTRSKEIANLVFYHFQSMHYLQEGWVDMRVNMYPGCVQAELVEMLYKEYLKKIEEKRNFLFRNYQLSYQGQIKERFDKKKFFFEDIMGERNPFLFLDKVWRLLVRKDRDYIRYR